MTWKGNVATILLFALLWALVWRCAPPRRGTERCLCNEATNEP